MTATPTRRAGLAMRERWSAPLNHIENGDPERHEEATTEPWPRPEVLADDFGRGVRRRDQGRGDLVRAGDDHDDPAVTARHLGPANAAIGMVMHCKAPSSISVKVDFPMTVLLSSAFEDPGAALALSHKLRQMPLETRLRTKLATSWQVARLLLSLRRPPNGPTRN